MRVTANASDCVVSTGSAGLPGSAAIERITYGIGIGGVVLGLFQAFSLRCAQIEEAIRNGDDSRVSSLDGSVDAIIDAILGYRPANMLYAHMQLQFVGCLIDQYSEDSDAVREHVKLLSHLMQQHFGSSSPRWQMPPLDCEPVSVPDAYVPNTDNGNFLNAAILEALPDRVAVLTKDYRCLYSNAANSARLGRKPMEMVGRHVTEIIGDGHFREAAKAKLDACFSGEQSDHIYARSENGRVQPLRCRMSPLRDSSGSIIGALVILEDVGIASGILAA
jgi:PAS domain S-box-containing protein